MIEVPYSSVPAMLRENAVRFGGQPAISYKKGGEFISLAYNHLYERVLMAARGLVKAGVKPGDRVAILSENRAGWAISDFGIQSVRAVTVPIYATNTPDQIAYVLNHSEAKIVFVSNRIQYEKLLAVREQIPLVEMAISYDRFMGSPALPVYTLYQLSEVSHPLTSEERRLVEAEIDRITPEDLITIIYTSGTTGVPKGVMLTQANMLFDAFYGVKKLGGMAKPEVFLSFLPLSHVLERTAGYHAALMHGCHVAFAESVEKVVENIVEVRPTTMVSVPRLFEKIYSRIYENVHLMSPLKRRMFHKAVEIGREYVHCRYIRREAPGLLGVQYRMADRLVFRKIREKFGSRLRFCISGGAPLDKTINEFMWIIGIPTFEGYGLTETSPAITLNNIDEVRFGSVGRVLEKTEVRLAEDGELLVRGPQVMRGYYRNEEATAQTVVDGWLSTGDIARVDEEGFVYIVDRKKEIIVTAGGKNIAPQPIENELKLDKYISQAFVFGDRQPYLVALITPNMERLIELAHQEKVHFFDVEDLVTNERVRALFEERIGAVNARLPSYETIKKFVILPRDFSVEGGELTPTLKLKRKVICEKYKNQIDRLYFENGTGSAT
ncbi:long-chain fatty acid--CoA ligase [Desulfuromonas sp. TF]|uniref:AMP-dependent synthetase/ligase n=1 Tax=Desulfuromonas sp. TF TaxID=1232410 RepID=UPI00040713FC|nr:long-chain fatty acid--CoA ligase [Desulfuromonas sp. TF]